jgi:hypothetical protein
MLLDTKGMFVMATQPLIIQYTNLLHQYRDPAAKPIRDFVAQHSGDKVFLKRAEVLNQMFKLKNELVTHG